MVVQATLSLFGSFFVLLLAGVPLSAGIRIAPGGPPPFRLPAPLLPPLAAPRRLPRPDPLPPPASWQAVEADAREEAGELPRPEEGDGERDE